MDKLEARNRRLFLVYGLKPGQWEAMLAAQGGVCAICKKKKRRYDTDHDHKTGRVRGVICHRCNSLLGHARDSMDILNSAAQYLARFVSPPDSVEQKQDTVV